MLDSEIVSPDGRLRLLIRSPKGDITVGFDGFPWHIHGDVLATMSGDSPQRATEKFVAALIQNKTIVAISKKEGRVLDIWTTDSPSREVNHCQPDETLEFRLWNGEIVKII